MLFLWVQVIRAVDDIVDEDARAHLGHDQYGEKEEDEFLTEYAVRPSIQLRRLVLELTLVKQHFAVFARVEHNGVHFLRVLDYGTARQEVFQRQLLDFACQHVGYSAFKLLCDHARRTDDYHYVTIVVVDCDLFQAALRHIWRQLGLQTPLTIEHGRVDVAFAASFSRL